MKNKNQEFEPLFKADKDWQCNACINWSYDPIEVYTIGYKEAADSLVKKIIRTKRNQDTLVYPICFLYRQYIELRLKEVIRSGRVLLDEGKSFPHHHKIKSLWQTAKGIINKVFPNDSKSPELLLVEHLITEFANLDPDSFAFRYPMDKTGNNPLEGMYHINLRHLFNCINKFGDVIELISNAISVEIDIKREIKSYY